MWWYGYVGVDVMLWMWRCRYRGNRNHNFQTSKAPLKVQVQSSGLFTSAASNQRGCPEDSPLRFKLPEPIGVTGGRAAVKAWVV